MDGEQSNSILTENENEVDENECRDVKVKVEQWEENKRRAVLRIFFKDLKREGLGDRYRNAAVEVTTNDPITAFQRVQMELNRVEEEEKARLQENLEKQLQREKAIAAYKEKKALRYKMLNLKNMKGQPVLKKRIELLLEKIKNEYCNE